MLIKKNAFSLVEVILAIAIFAIITGGGIVGLIPALNQNRQSGEITIANRLAEEGLEAVRSIRSRDFNLITSGAKGVGTSSNLWTFNGTSDTTDKYTRQITINPAYRDGSGNLALSGTLDPDTWLVKSTINWNFSVGDTKQFSLDTVLTNWKKPIISVSYDGLIVYSDGTTKPPWRSYTTSTNTFSTESTMPSLVGSPRNFVIRTSPKKIEAIAGMVTSTGVLYVYCFDGVTWTQDWSTTVGGTATTRRFDIAYESNSGKAVVLYSTNAANTNELASRTKSGATSCGSANWSGATNYDPLRTSGIVQWVKMNPDPRTSSNLIATIWADANSDLSAAIWDGSTFQNEPSAVTEASLEVVTTSQDVDDFDLAYESITGDLMLVWANSAGNNGTNGVRYRLCTGGTSTCAWGAITTPPTFADDATNLDISANPNSDEIVFASIGNANQDLQIGYWNGSSWTNTANVMTKVQNPPAGTKLVTTGWLTSGATTRSVVIYDNKKSKLSWHVGNGGVFTAQTDFTTTPNLANPQKWYESATNPKNKNQLMLSITDNGSDLFAKRLIMDSTPTFTWTNSNGATALELTLGQSTVKPFGFAWWQK
ncbi:MAG: prepilin-type N-terminal cleavage/methylation domain-containing protein [Candidatus Shapirobacteria bacterium]